MKFKKNAGAELGEIFQQYVPPLQDVGFRLLSRVKQSAGREPESLLRRTEKEVFNLSVRGLEDFFSQSLYSGVAEGEYPSYGISVELQEMAEKIIRWGFIKIIRHHHLLNDEPKLFLVGSKNGDFLKNNSDSGGPSSSTANASSLTSRNDAFTKFLGETFERTSCAFYKKSSLIFSSFNNLKSKDLNAVNPKDFAGFSERQLKTENLLAKTRVSNDSILGWVWGKFLVTGKKILLPAQTVYTPYRYENNEPIIRLPITTGAAAHTDKNEAFYRGICEVIERDAFMIFWLNRLSPPLIDLENSFAGYFKSILKSIRRYNLEIYVLDITTDIPIPSFLTLIIDRTGLGPIVSPGNKADIDVKKAIIGSIEEALKVRYFGRHQFMMNRGLIPQAVKKYKFMKTTTERCLFWSRIEMLKEIEFFLKGQKSVIREESTTMSPKEKMEKAFEYFKNNNLDVIAVDTTLPQARECGFSAVMVVIPELQPLSLWEEYKCLGGKRLYGVPVKLGYFKKPLEEENLNPLPHPFL